MSRLLVNHASFVRAIPAGCWIKPLTCLPGPVGEFVAGSQGARVLRALDPLADGQQRGELVAGPGRIPLLPGPAGKVVAGGQGVRVLGAQDPLADGQQRGELVAAPAASPPPRSSGRGWSG